MGYFGGTGSKIRSVVARTAHSWPTTVLAATPGFIDTSLRT
jgi:hypothetical protein